MKSIKKNLAVFLSIVFISLIPIMSFADDHLKVCDPGAGKLCNPINQDNVKDFILVILSGILKIAIPVVVLAIIYSGFLFVAARGNPEDLSKAKSALMYTLIGTGILLASMEIAKLIAGTVTAL